MIAPPCRHSMSKRARGDSGSAGVETAIAVVALLSVMFFVVGALRITNAGGDVKAAARAGARAAATANSAGEAQARASRVTADALSERGVSCDGGPSVSTSGGGIAQSIVTVTVSCTVSLGDVLFGGFPGSRNVTSSAVEFTDQIRGF